MKWSVRQLIMGPVYLSTAVALASSFLYLLGFWLAFRLQPPNRSAARLARMYLGLALTWALVQVGRSALTPQFLSSGLFRLSPFMGLLLLGILFFFLTRAFFEQASTRGLIRYTWAWLALSVFLVVVALALPALSTGAVQGAGGPAKYMLVAGWAFFMGASMYLTARALRQPLRYYSAASYWVAGMLLLVLGDGLFFAGYLNLGSLVRLPGALLAVYVASAQQLPELGRSVRRSSRYLLFTSVAILIYTAGLGLVQLFLLNWPGVSPLMAGLALALLVVLVFTPLLGVIQKRLSNWIVADERDPTEMLRQYSQSITNTLDLNLLATVAVGTASEFLELTRGYLFVVDLERPENGRNRYQLRGVKGMGTVNPEPGSLPETSPLAQYLREEHKPVLQAEINQKPRFQAATGEERQWMTRLGVDVYVPIYSKNEWIGLLALGPKGSGSPYTTQDLALLSTMADQTGVALENSRLVEGLVRLNNEFRRAYAALDQANRHLERLDKTKSNFINIASHELRTPLTLISGAAQMLLDEPQLAQDEYFQQLLSKINTGTARLQQIMESMFDMATIDMRALELELQPTSINKLVQMVITDLANDIAERQLTVTANGLDHLPSVMADSPALRKVFYHLIVNAVKYTPDGGKISISGRVLEPNPPELPPGGVEVIVSDTGIGIDPRFQELIFAKFYQTGVLAFHSSGRTKFKGGGPGLGLAITRGIIEAHQGKIWVESPGYDEEACPGSQFHIILPLKLMERPHLEGAGLAFNS